MHPPAAPAVRRRDFLRWTGITAVGLGALGLPGCSVLSGGDSASGGRGGSGVLTVATQRSLDNLDPHGPFAATEQIRLFGQQVFDTLVAREGGQLVPAVATSWENPEPTVWRFTLREDVTWHDGSPLTAEDAAYSVRRQAEADSPLSNLWSALSEVTTDGPATLVVRTEQPLGTVLANLSLLRLLPAGKADAPDFFRSPIGSGPFRVTSFVPGDHLELAAHTTYWNGAPAAGGLLLRSIPEVTTRITALESGEVQLTWPLPSDQIARLRQNGDLRLYDSPSYQHWFNWFNCSRAPFTDPRVRQAMWHAIDAESLVANVFPETAAVAQAPITSAVFGFAAQRPYAYDPQRARDLLAEAGLAGGFRTSLIWNRTQAPQIRQVAETFVSSWREIGVEVVPQELEEAQWLERLLALDWDMDLQTNVTATGDADYTLGRLYTSAANRLGYANPELDTVLAGARSSVDQAERERLYGRACQILWEDAVGIWPIEMRMNFATTTDVTGFEPTPHEAPELRTVNRAV
ncbi:ABC transporter substrate-binding protein [Pseudonocardia zijingensis]|jgi:peptide/nickel transport system substrate-binding protein|uniref:ABC transporter substrate-binding protein n=1 Tax=Pseudonocardia zijingensis TaxID=153376 RepID=A0ABN1N866_9PSEU